MRQKSPPQHGRIKLLVIFRSVLGTFCPGYRRLSLARGLPFCKGNSARHNIRTRLPETLDQAMNPHVFNVGQSGSATQTNKSPRIAKRRPSFKRRLLERLFNSFGQPNVTIELTSGEQIQPPLSKVPSVGRIRFVDNGAFWRVISDPMFQFGEMYSTGRILIEGPIDDVTIELFRAMRRAGSHSNLSMRLSGWLHWPRGSTLRDSQKNIHHHYDIGNDFYSLWLDERMAYTCAYFSQPSSTLEDAQIAKFNHVCHKLRLKPNMRVIEAGCGWGGLALHMARHYGVRVQAYNISHEQISFARQRARDEGLDSRVEFIEADWRTIAGPCDVFISVGMLEHVGQRNYRLLGQVINRALKPGGRGLIHSIGQNVAAPTGPWIERRIFPGANPPTLSEMMQTFEPNGFSVLDVENIRLHYALTIRHWIQRFQAHEQQIRAMFDDKFVRMWRMYLAGSLAAFETGSYQLFQVLFNRADDNDVTWTRDYLYRDMDGSASNSSEGKSIFPTSVDQ